MRRGGRVQGGWAGRGGRVRTSGLPPRPAPSTSYAYDAGASRPVRLKPPPITPHAEGEHVISRGPSGVSRLRFYPAFLGAEEADEAFRVLEGTVPWAQREDRHGPQPRLTAWYGPHPYAYSRLTMEPAAAELPPLLASLRDRIAALSGAPLNSCLCNLYRDHGDSVDWHSDDETGLGEWPTIASLSLGDQRLFLLRQRPPDGDDFSLSQEVKLYLPHGSLLLMDGATQRDWQHSLPKDYHDKGPRINLTFRNIHPPES